MRTLLACLQVELFSTDIARVLNILNDCDITLYNVEYANELTVILTISRTDFKRIKKLKNKGFHVKVKKYKGVYWYACATLRRPILIFTIVLLLFVTLLLPTKILFVRVSGNLTIPANYIVEEGKTCGIKFWASRRDVRSEQVKNDLLERIPQLKWAAVTTAGCTATIHVAEEQIQEENQTFKTGHVVAAHDGIIEEIIVTKGNATCRPGDAVRSGQTLISGYTDCGLIIQATQAEGEVYARTLRNISLVAMEATMKYTPEDLSENRYSILIGKKLIKLYKDSGISDSTCVKIYTQRVISLPGGLKLPVSLIQETWTYRSPADVRETASMYWLEQSGRNYITGQMLAGCILDETVSYVAADGVHYLDGTYHCREMIGLMKYEEIIQRDTESDR